jgi:hypothetical protein
VKELASRSAEKRGLGLVKLAHVKGAVNMFASTPNSSTTLAPHKGKTKGKKRSHTI